MTTISAALHNDIVDFLASLPNLHDSSTQLAFINRVVLDPQLHHQISFPGATAQFFELLVPQLLRYGKLADGRHALEAVLETAKDYVGADRQKTCAVLLARLRQELQAGPPAASQPRPDFRTLLGWLNRLVEAEFNNMIYTLLSVEQQNVLTQPVNRGNFLGDMQRWERLQDVAAYLRQAYPERFSR